MVFLHYSTDLKAGSLAGGMVKQTKRGNTKVNKLTPGAPCTVTAGICVLLFLTGLS